MFTLHGTKIEAAATIRSVGSLSCGLSAENRRNREVLGNGSENTSVTIQLLSSHRSNVAADAHAIVEQLLEAVLSVRSGPRAGCHYKRVLRRQLEKCGVGVKSAASPTGEERTQVDVTEQSGKERD
jgi:hypothetical protein